VSTRVECSEDDLDLSLSADEPILQPAGNVA